MAETVEMYRKMLEEIEPGWREEPKRKQDGAAGVAVAVAVLNGDAPDEEHIPDFNAAQINRAFNRLDRSGYFAEEDGTLKLCANGEEELHDGLWWTLLSGVAIGYMERSR